MLRLYGILRVSCHVARLHNGLHLVAKIVGIYIASRHNAKQQNCAAHHRGDTVTVCLRPLPRPSHRRFPPGGADREDGRLSAGAGAGVAAAAGAGVARSGSSESQAAGGRSGRGAGYRYGRLPARLSGIPTALCLCW